MTSDRLKRLVRDERSQQRPVGNARRHRPGCRIGLGILLAALTSVCGAADEGLDAPLMDAAPLTAQSVVTALDDGGFVRIDVLTERLFRVRYSKTGQWAESALNRYGVLTATFPETPFDKTDADGAQTLATKHARLGVRVRDGAITLTDADGKAFTEQAAPEYQDGGGYDVRFALADDERLYGLGDVSRENVMRRGGTYEFWVRNVNAYIPIPVIFSSRGWGMLMNTTWRNTFDVGKTDPQRLVCRAPRSDLDYYLFCGPDYRSLLDTYTTFSGRPALLPIWGYAFTYVCNQNIDAFNLLNEALTFRREGMPCDVIGLEPGWMSKFYDYSTDKIWHPQRFPIPSWAPKGAHTFLAALGRKGFKLSLWLCCDYDLAVYEEQLLAGRQPSGASPAAKDDGVNVVEGFEDQRLTTKPAAKKDAAPASDAPKPLEPWFEHLKKFVDQGAAAFKLDGSNQVIEHPTRKWGNGMSDEQMHNLYPVIYAKQMAHGFEQHTARRAMVYSAGGWTGVQQYVATWAGDTGGGAKPLASMLNLGFSGHSNHSCDMTVTNIEGLHFGFLQTWAQQNNWDYWFQPWFLEDTHTQAFREYDRLRYRLLPYLYCAAAEAAATGYPVMRAMPLAYPEDPAWDACLGQYMLGDDLLVSAFVKEVRLPPGEWIDFWSNERFQGPSTIPVRITPSRGGALLVKRGAIIPTWPIRDHVEKGWSPEVNLLVYPAAHSSFTLYEDDGQSLDYRRGKFARTLITCETSDARVRLAIDARQGSYAGMPATRQFAATVHLPKRPKTVALDGAEVADAEWNETDGTVTVRIPDCGNTPRVLVLDGP